MSLTRRITRWAATLLAAGFLLVAGAWWIEGGRWVRVETPSMGQAAPVGTLLWIKPVDFAQLEVGDLITFHRPGRSSETYSHRVYRINADHTITTKGVIPAPDPWRLTAKDVVGKVHMRWWGVGWLVLAAPLLIIGGLAAGGIVHFARERWKVPAGLVLGSLVLTVAITVYRPLSNAEQIAFTPAGSGGANASYVGTGLLPIRLQAHNGANVVLDDGQVGVVHVARADTDHKLRVTLQPAVPWTFWLALVLACMIPALYSLTIELRQRSTHAPLSA